MNSTPGISSPRELKLICRWKKHLKGATVNLTHQNKATEVAAKLSTQSEHWRVFVA